MTVDGAGSTWTASRHTYVGHYGTGVVNLTNGGTWTHPWLLFRQFGDSEY